MIRLIDSLVVGLLAAVIATAPVVAQADSHSTPKPRSERESPSVPTKSRPGTPRSSASQENKPQPVIVDADRMESLRKQGIVIFSGNVVARQNNSTHYADRMEVYLDERGEQVHRTISTGNVRVVTRDCRIGTAHRAEYYDEEQRVVLIGDARVWQDDNVVTGERITIYLAEERSIVERGKTERVQAVFYPSSGTVQQNLPAGVRCPE